MNKEFGVDEESFLKDVDMSSTSYFDFLTGRNKPSNKTCGIPHVDSFELLSEKFCSKNKKKVSGDGMPSFRETSILNDKWLNFEIIESLVLPSMKRKKDEGAMKAGKAD
jgi:hypothetical protein